jgi:hypothetical protein
MNLNAMLHYCDDYLIYFQYRVYENSVSRIYQR